MGLLALPAAAQSIPGRYRVALGERMPVVSNVVEGVIDRVAPIPTALPAPALVEQSVDVSALLAVENEVAAVAEPTALPPTHTPVPTATAVSDVAAVATEAPTEVPTVTPAPPATLAPTPAPLPTAVRLEGMGVIRQTFNNCGPANLTQTLNFHGLDVTQDQVADFLKPNSEDRNVSPWQIADYVNDQTFLKATVHSGGNIEMLKQFIAAGYPVVIEKGYLPNTSNAPGWWGHYLTVFGYDDETEIFYSQDSYLGPWDGSGREDNYADLEEFWRQFNYTFYVVYPESEETIVNEILGSEMLDEFTMWRNTAAIAQAQTEVNPEDEFAWFNLGTSLTRMGGLTGEQQYYQGGAEAFDRARAIGLPPRMLWYQFQPYLAYMRVGRYQDMIDLADATLTTQGGRNVEETYW